MKKKIYARMDSRVIFTTVLGLALFFYLRFAINPVLYFTAQEPVFFFDNDFWAGFITHPGGVLEYVAALLSQFFLMPWLGALVIFLLFAGIFLLFAHFVRITFKPEYAIFALIPVAILFFAHHNYEHALVLDVVVLMSLLMLYFYSRLHSRTARLFVILLGPIFYVLTGSAFLLFCLYAVVYEALTFRFAVPMILLILMAVIFPVISAAGLFLVRTRDAFLQPAFPDSQLSIITVVLYLSIPVLMLLLYAATKINLSFSVKSKTAFGITVLLVAAVFLGISFLATNTVEKNFWEITYYSQRGEWQKILDKGENPCPDSPQIYALINRALYHSGQLGDALFFYPQDFGLGGLFVMDDTQLSSPLIRSDLYFDLGHYNEAKHWAHEAVSVKGETMWNLQRLVTVLLIYDQKQAAAVYINKLKHNVLARKWAKQVEPYVKNNVNIRNHPDLGPLLKNVVSENFLSFAHNPVPDLYKLLQANPLNKAASEYLMASLLLNKKVAQCAELVQRNFKYTTAPRHYQEALIFYASQTRDDTLNLSDYVDQSTVDRFRAFQSSFQANRQNEQLARKALAVKYGDTFWYYLVFHQQGRGA